MGNPTVLHLCVSGGIGGIETLLREIAERSACRHAFCFAESGGDAADALMKTGCRVWILGVDSKEAYAKFPGQVEKICREIKPDVIVTHNEAPYLWLAARCMKAKYKVPYYMYIHSAAENVVHSGAGLPQMKALLFSGCAEKAKGLICISGYVMQSVARRFPKLRKKLILVYNGIDTERFQGKCRETPDAEKDSREVILMYSGRLVPEKGVDVLLSAFKIVEKQIPHARLRIIGDGPEREKLEKFAAETGIAGKVSFEGFRSDVDRCLREADIFIHPALWNEGFGIAVAEAMCAGNIVVAEAHGAIPELITDGREGFLVKEDGTGPLADGILRAAEIIGTKEEFKMRTAAEKKARKFSINFTVQKLDALWGAEPIRIGVFGISEFPGGTESFLMNLWRGLDKSKIQFDFLLNHGAGRLPWEDEIYAGGGRIYREYYAISERSLAGYLTPADVLDRHPDWKGVYLNVQYIHTALRLLDEAMRRGMRYRILHAHNTGYDHALTAKEKLYEAYFYKIGVRTVTACLACSKEAGEWLFRGRPFTVIPNAIDVKKFRADETVRGEMRERLGIKPEETVVGFCARLEEQKNPLFALEIFGKFHEKMPESRFLIVGDGSLKKKIVERADELGISDRVIFAGCVTDTAPYYNAMDAFLMPSRFEGFGISAIEAQAAGLWCCVTKNAVPETVNLTGRVTFISEDADPDVWAEALIRNGFDRADTYPVLMKSDYTIEKMEQKFIHVFAGKENHSAASDKCHNPGL